MRTGPAAYLTGTAQIIISVVTVNVTPVPVIFSCDLVLLVSHCFCKRLMQHREDFTRESFTSIFSTIFANSKPRKVKGISNGNWTEWSTIQRVFR